MKRMNDTECNSSSNIARRSGNNKTARHPHWPRPRAPPAGQQHQLSTPIPRAIHSKFVTKFTNLIFAIWSSFCLLFLPFLPASFAYRANQRPPMPTHRLPDASPLHRQGCLQRAASGTCNISRLMQVARFVSWKCRGHPHKLHKGKTEKLIQLDIKSV